jgi:hypothetical protein
MLEFRSTVICTAFGLWLLPNCKRYESVSKRGFLDRNPIDNHSAHLFLQNTFFCAIGQLEGNPGSGVVGAPSELHKLTERTKLALHGRGELDNVKPDSRITTSSKSSPVIPRDLAVSELLPSGLVV